MCRIYRIIANRIICLSAASVLWLSFVPGCGIVPDSRDKAREHGRALSLLSIELVPSRDYKGYPEPNEWWDDLISALNMDFWHLCWSEDYEQYLTSLIHQFGKHGPMADMKLCIADASIMLAQDSPPPSMLFSAFQGIPELEKVAAKYTEIQNLVSKIQVEMFLQNPSVFERYYNMIIWSHQFLRNRSGMWGSFMYKLNRLDESWDPLDEREYWWYAREFMLLVHATGRDDLLRRADATELYSCYEEWREWVGTNVWKETGWTRFFPHASKPIWIERDSLLAYGRALLNEPSLPFPDWESKALPPPPGSDLLRTLMLKSSYMFGPEVPWSTDCPLSGESAGVALHVRELPYLGKAILVFPARGKILYASSDYCGGIENYFADYAEVLFTGVADGTDIMEYCREKAWGLTLAGAYTDEWNTVLLRYDGSIDPNDFPIASASTDYELFGYLDMGGREVCQLRINYNSKESRFTGHASCLMPREPKSEEGQEP